MDFKYSIGQRVVVDYLGTKLYGRITEAFDDAGDECYIVDGKTKLDLPRQVNCDVADIALCPSIKELLANPETSSIATILMRDDLNRSALIDKTIRDHYKPKS